MSFHLLTFFLFIPFNNKMCDDRLMNFHFEMCLLFVVIVAQPCYITICFCFKSSVCLPDVVLVVFEFDVILSKGRQIDTPPKAMRGGMVITLLSITSRPK